MRERLANLISTLRYYFLLTAWAEFFFYQLKGSLGLKGIKIAGTVQNRQTRGTFFL